MSGAQVDTDHHIGRSFKPGSIEQECPCPVLPCGLVSQQAANEVDCPQHALGSAKTIRSAHDADKCPGEM